MFSFLLKYILANHIGKAKFLGTKVTFGRSVLIILTVCIISYGKQTMYTKTNLKNILTYKAPEKQTINTKKYIYNKNLHNLDIHKCFILIKSSPIILRYLKQIKSNDDQNKRNLICACCVSKI